MLFLNVTVKKKTTSIKWQNTQNQIFYINYISSKWAQTRFWVVLCMGGANTFGFVGNNGCSVLFRAQTSDYHNTGN